MKLPITVAVCLRRSALDSCDGHKNPMLQSSKRKPVIDQDTRPATSELNYENPSFYILTFWGPQELQKV